ncbi:uncharacterized protein KZ484_023431 isoform 2-T2 [Pholidichthys leucotaenia]
MEEVKDDKVEEPAGRGQKFKSSSQTSAFVQPLHTCWSHTVVTLLPWYRFAPAFAVFSMFHLEALLHPSLPLLDVCWSLFSVGLVGAFVAGCIHGLRCCLWPGQMQDEPETIQEEVSAETIETEIQSSQCSWTPPSQTSAPDVDLTLALADSLLLCVLQESLPDSSVPHIQDLLSRLESVSHTLEKADIGSDTIQEEVDKGAVLTDKLKLICTYLQQRIGTLHIVVQVQGDFEATVKDMLQGLDGLWGQLEELHAGVTLTKSGSQDHKDLTSTQTDAQTLFSVLGHYGTKLQSCQTYLKDSTQLLQELTWSHTHICSSVNSSSESVWPELLLQSNIEQLDKVQENFIVLQQQISAFQAHLEGLGKENQERNAESSRNAHAGSEDLSSGSLQMSPHVPSEVSLEHQNSSSSYASTSSMDTGTATETEASASLCERPGAVALRDPSLPEIHGAAHP